MFWSDKPATVFPPPCPPSSVCPSAVASAFWFPAATATLGLSPHFPLWTFSSISKGLDAKWNHTRGEVDHRDKKKKSNSLHRRSSVFCVPTTTLLFPVRKCWVCCGSSEEQRPPAQFLISVPLPRFGQEDARGCFTLLAITEEKNFFLTVCRLDNWTWRDRRFLPSNERFSEEIAERSCPADTVFS